MSEIAGPGAGNTQTLNGISISYSNVRHEEGRVLIDVCHDVPDDSDWIMEAPRFEYGGEVLAFLEVHLIEVRRPAVDGIQEVFTPDEVRFEPDENEGIGLRCDQIIAAVPASYSGPAMLTIDAISAYPSEGGVCEAEYLARMNAGLDAIHPDLEADCFILDFEGGGGASGVEIVALPEGWTQEEADAVLTKDFYTDLHGIHGPWVFEFEVD